MQQLCNEIGMPNPVTQALLELDKNPQTHYHTEKLMDPAAWEEGLDQLRAEIGPDPDGFIMLCCQLRCARAARARYRALMLPEQVYTDTMAAFTRFVNEHRASYGRYGFDRDFWMVRQVSCMLFRIGQLEYELLTHEGRPLIVLHIPSDANLERSALRRSYVQARALLNRAFPAYADVPMVSESWLFSPALREFLPPSSKILQFQEAFTIQPGRDCRQDVLQWVFKRTDLPLEQLPEYTSLQRALKPFLQQGGSIPLGRVVLNEEPFL